MAEGEQPTGFYALKLGDLVARYACTQCPCSIEENGQVFLDWQIAHGFTGADFTGFTLCLLYILFWT